MDLILIFLRKAGARDMKQLSSWEWQMAILRLGSQREQCQHLPFSYSALSIDATCCALLHFYLSLFLTPEHLQFIHQKCTLKTQF